MLLLESSASRRRRFYIGVSGIAGQEVSSTAAEGRAEGGPLPLAVGLAAELMLALLRLGSPTGHAGHGATGFLSTMPFPASFLTSLLCCSP